MRIATVVSFLLLCSSCSTLKKPFLYRAVRGNESITLLGTIHVGVPKSDLPGVVFDELLSSDAAYFESEITTGDISGDSRQSRKDREQWRKSAVQRMYLGKGEPSLEKRLPPEYYARLKKRLSLIKPELLNQLNPHGAMSLLLFNSEATVTRYEANMLNPYYMMDYQLQEEAREKRIPLGSLDSERVPCRYEFGSGRLADLMGVLDGKDSRGFLDDAFNLVEAYRTGEENSIRPYFDEGDDGGFGICVLGKRNKTWADKLDHAAGPKRKIFVAVGCAHLLTQKQPSLLELLRKKGFTVSRVEK